MKNIILTIISLSTLTIHTYAKVPVDENDIYLGAGFAIQSADKLDSGLGLILKGGFPFKNLKDGPGNLGVEAEFTHSIISPSKGSYEVDFSTLGGYATYTYEFTEDFYAKGRAGMVYYSVDKSSYGNDGMEVSVGIGAGYQFSENINFYIDHTVTDELSNFSLGAEYKFKGLR
ncbi:porin family protein [Sulfurimonas lithotrophica]|uniref:Porin family protein n=1 Tax=Sulfurimonas lithotrophica TaxID=2590022 RepID=A0A5P8P3Y9_9BACT|nr:outer membrane beta-barrel protein [Sulfurimonas lithotrophica]QFR50250.1 porin family protein [Sulfurimonas lithotrophica]